MCLIKYNYRIFYIKVIMLEQIPIEEIIKWHDGKLTFLCRLFTIVEWTELFFCTFLT
jgi:hypothetical protein